MQFQIATVQYYEKQLYGKTVTREQAVTVAMDETQAYQLARDIGFTTGKGSKDWVNCSKKLGTVEKVAFIKQFEN